MYMFMQKETYRQALVFQQTEEEYRGLHGTNCASHPVNVYLYKLVLAIWWHITSYSTICPTANALLTWPELERLIIWSINIPLSGLTFKIHMNEALEQHTTLILFIYANQTLPQCSLKNNVSQGSQWGFCVDPWRSVRRPLNI